MVVKRKTRLSSRNPRVERRTIRAARRAIHGEKPGVGPGFWAGMASSLAVTGSFVLVGMLLFWAIKAQCAECPGYACQTNLECGTCACAVTTGQPYGACVPVSVARGE